MYAENNVNIQNTIAFLNTRIELKTEYHLQQHQIMKYVSVSLTEYVQKLYAAKQNLMKTVREDINKRGMLYVHGWKS